MYIKAKNNKWQSIFIITASVITLNACAPYPPAPIVQESGPGFRNVVLEPQSTQPLTSEVIQPARIEEIPFAEVIPVPSTPSINRVAIPTTTQTTIHDQSGFAEPRIRPTNSGRISNNHQANAASFHDRPIAVADDFNTQETQRIQRRYLPPAQNTGYDRRSAYVSSPAFNRWVAEDTFANNMYRVKQGDTVFQIMRVTGVSWEEIIRLNGLQPPFTIYEGQQLRLR